MTGDGIPSNEQIEALRAEVRVVRAENKRLRALIDQTADGTLVPDCEQMFCPRCLGKLRLEYDIAYCDNCPNPDGCDKPPLPLLFSQCYSTRETATAAGGE